MSEDEIVDAVSRLGPCRLVVITGGNPAMYDLERLVTLLTLMGKTVHVETQGTIRQGWLRLADLVTISPKANGPQSTIAAASPNLRDAVGNIVGIIGDPDFPLTVNISGVTVDGADVASEAGVLYLDAMGSYSRSRVTDVVTSMGPNAFSIPGGYRSAQLGYGLAQVTAATVTPAQTGTRVLTIDASRVDGYNTAAKVRRVK